MRASGVFQQVGCGSFGALATRMVVLDHGAVGIRWFMARRKLHGCPNVAVKLVVCAMGIRALMLAYKIGMMARSAM